MTVVVTLEDYRPSPRYDGEPWTDARIEEAPASTGPWVTLETQALTPVDADPSDPVYRNFTTELASDTPELWYRIVWVDAHASTSPHRRMRCRTSRTTSSCTRRPTSSPAS